jgi:hypothetical protein
VCGPSIRLQPTPLQANFPNNLGALPPRIAIFCSSESVVVANPCLDPFPQAGRLMRRLILHFIGNDIANLDTEGQSFSE